MRQQRHLTVIMPGLFQFSKEHTAALMAAQARLQPQQNRRPKALEVILSRATTRCLSQNAGPGLKKTTSQKSMQCYVDLIFRLFITHRNEGDLPIAALSALFHGIDHHHDQKKWYLRADPIHLRPDGDHLIVLGNQGLQISMEEAQRLCAEINNTYHDMPWRLFVLTPTEWLLESDEEPKIRTHALDEVIGFSLKNYLPHGDHAKQWLTVFNELQMLLHVSPVNTARSAVGNMPINSVWFWGGGRLPLLDAIAPSKSWVQCWSNESLSLALAQFANVPGVDLPVNGREWLNQATTAGRHLVVLDDLNIPMQDSNDWWQTLQRLNQHWLSPCVDAVRQGELTGLSLITNHCQFDLHRHLLKRWWKRITPLHCHVPEQSTFVK
ncbi:MAG: hypothetical protein GXP08_10790 [Gammaproteobacteria bacterium]|nr:hypothetical protein [Gammaproteobacteria bacterium]